MPLTSRAPDRGAVISGGTERTNEGYPGRLLGRLGSGSRWRVSTQTHWTCVVLMRDRAPAGGREDRPLMGCRARRDRREHLFIRPLVVLPQAADQQSVSRDGRSGFAVRRGRLGRGPPRRRDPGRVGTPVGQGPAARGCGGDGPAACADRRASRRPTADTGQVAVGIETDRGPWVRALVAAGYQVFAVNPLQAARFRQRRSVSGAKSDAADAHTLADMVRTDSPPAAPGRR